MLSDKQVMQMMMQKLVVLVKGGGLFDWVCRKLAHDAVTHFQYLMSALMSSRSGRMGGSQGHQLKLGGIQGAPMGTNQLEGQYSGKIILETFIYKSEGSQK